MASAVSPKETADIEAAITKGVDGIMISPNDVDALAPAIQEAVDAKIPVVTIDRRVNKVPGILAHVGADNVKGGEAQGKLIEKLFPNGATVMNLQGQSGSSPAIDRNKGLHNVLDQAKDKYKIVFEDTAGFDRPKGMAMTESALGGHGDPPGRHRCRKRRHGARRARGPEGPQLARQGETDRLRRFARGARADQGRQHDSHYRAIARRPDARCAPGLVAFLRDGKKPDQQVILLTPIAITSDNLNQAERLNEVK